MSEWVYAYGWERKRNVCIQRANVKCTECLDVGLCMHDVSGGGCHTSPLLLLVVSALLHSRAVVVLLCWRADRRERMTRGKRAEEEERARGGPRRFRYSPF